MLIEKITVNVGEDNAIYVELHDIDTPEDELKYGDCRYNIDGETEVWYGANPNDAMSGWQVTPWSSSNVTAFILNNTRNKKAETGDANLIYRVMNNDIEFDEDKYLAIPHNSTLGVGHE